jgi:hypothetical protein
MNAKQSFLQWKFLKRMEEFVENISVLEHRLVTVWIVSIDGILGIIQNNSSSVT